MKEFIIWRNDVASSLRINPILKPSGLKCILKIDPSCLSLKSTDIFCKIHRLVGITNGWWDKFWIGWTVNKNNQIDLFGCFSTDGAQFESYLTSVDTGKLFEAKISINASGLCCFEIDTGTERKFSRQELPYYFSSGFGFKLYPRLHNMIAPNDLKFSIKWL